MMKQQEIHSYLDQFFTTTNCDIVENSTNYLTVQLTNEMDKLLMNRPFYWHYIEKTGGIPNPQKLTLITEFKQSNEIKGELIHFGSPRLHQIFQITKKMGGYIRLFENEPGNENHHTALIPWFCLNVKISYLCDRRKDILRSIGMNLLNGGLMDDFHQQLTERRIDFVPKIPDFAFTFTPIFKPESGLRRIQQYIENDIMKDNHSWATEARQRWQEDEQLLDSFYIDVDEKPERYMIEKEALKEQYEPKIEVTIINGGLFYLTKQWLQ